MRVSAQKHAVSTSSSCRLDRALQPKLFARGTATAQQSTLASTTAARLTSKKSVTSYTLPCTTSQQDCSKSAKGRSQLLLHRAIACTVLGASIRMS
jgi:hypothetical protein